MLIAHHAESSHSKVVRCHTRLFNPGHCKKGHVFTRTELRMKKTGKNANIQNKIKIQYSKAPQFQAAKIEHKNQEMDLKKKNVKISNIWKGSDPDPQCAKNRKRIDFEAVGAYL